MRSKRSGKGLEMLECYGLTQSLSDRSLGGLDGAAALPAASSERQGLRLLAGLEGKRTVIEPPGASEKALFSLLR